MNISLFLASMILSFASPHEQFFDFTDQEVKVGQIHRSHFYYNFCSRSHDLEEHNKLLLDSIETFLINNPSVSIEIGKHSDWRGSEAYNQHLTEVQAKSIMKYFLDKNFNPRRLSSNGYGESMPIITPEEIEALEEDRVGWAHNQNNRIEITITKTDEEFVGLDCIDSYTPN